VNDATAAVADKLLCVDFIYAFPSKRVVLIGRVDDVKLDRAAHSDAGAHELDGAGTGVECGARQVHVATSTADVVGVFQLKVTVRHQTASSHADHWSLTSRLQVWNTDMSNNSSCSVFNITVPHISACMQQCLYATHTIAIVTLIININKAITDDSVVQCYPAVSQFDYTPQC